MKKHKWENNKQENDKCGKCGILRKRKTFKLLMAIEGSKNYYKYETGYIYWDVNVPTTSIRPDCKPLNNHTR